MYKIISNVFILLLIINTMANSTNNVSNQEKRYNTQIEEIAYYVKYIFEHDIRGEEREKVYNFLHSKDIVVLAKEMSKGSIANQAIASAYFHHLKTFNKTYYTMSICKPCYCDKYCSSISETTKKPYIDNK